MNTQNLKHLRPPVGKLAKSSFPTPKLSNDKDLRVGRHPKQTPRVSERTRVGDFKEDKRENSFDLKAIKYLNQLFTDLLPDVKVCYHNPLYVQQIGESYSKTESAIFLQFVKTCAQFRCQAQNQSIILTHENDFLNAFKLMRQRKIEEYSSVKAKNKNKVWDLLKLKFKNRTFSAPMLAKELFYNYSLLYKIIHLLTLEHKIEFVKEFKGNSFYRLREKSNAYVTYR